MGVENGLDMEKIAAQEMGNNPENQELENEFDERVQETGETATALKAEMKSADPEVINGPAFQEKLSRLGEIIKRIATELAQGIKKDLKEEADLVKFLVKDMLIDEPKDAIVSKAEDLMSWIKHKKIMHDVNRIVNSSGVKMGRPARAMRLPRI